jgi:phosphatidylserine decarboxylase
VVLGSLARALDMDLTEAERVVEEYESFQRLFCRGLAPGARRCPDEPDLGVSPVDGELSAWGRVDPSLVLQIKGQGYAMDELLGDPMRAARYVGGVYLVFYLSPRDYHRMHSPVQARVTEYRWIRGDYWPVNSLAQRLPNVYCDNERVVSYLDSPLGLVAMVKVAAFGVGYISLTYLGEEAGERHQARGRPEHRQWSAADAPPLHCGDEIAAFGLGSTVVLLFEPDRVEPVAETLGGAVRVGDAVVRARRDGGRS